MKNIMEVVRYTCCSRLGKHQCDCSPHRLQSQDGSQGTTLATYASHIIYNRSTITYSYNAFATSNLHLQELYRHPLRRSPSFQSLSTTLDNQVVPAMQHQLRQPRLARQKHRCSLTAYSFQYPTLPVRTTDTGFFP